MTGIAAVTLNNDRGLPASHNPAIRVYPGGLKFRDKVAAHQVIIRIILA